MKGHKILIMMVVIVFKILSRGKEYSSDSYRIMFHLGVADCIQLIMQFPPSFWHVVGGRDFGFVGNKVSSFFQLISCRKMTNNGPRLLFLLAFEALCLLLQSEHWDEFGYITGRLRW